jgi:hypothetical protein
MPVPATILRQNAQPPSALMPPARRRAGNCFRQKALVVPELPSSLKQLTCGNRRHADAGGGFAMFGRIWCPVLWSGRPPGA